MEYFEIKLNTITSPHECGDYFQIAKVWESIGKRNFRASTFNIMDDSNFISETTNINFDVSGILHCIELYKNCIDDVDFPVEEWHQNAKMKIFFKSERNISQRLVLPIVNSLMNDLFVIANICTEGCMDTYGNQYLIPKEIEPYENPIQFDLNAFTDAWRIARNWGWPKIKFIDFDKAWDWLEKIDMISKPTAVTAEQKAIFCLHSVCDESVRAYPSKLVEIVQTLESLMKVPGNRIASIMSDRIHTILGEPPSDQNWLNKIYRIRSKIVHGDAPFIRIGYKGGDILEYANKEYLWALERGVAVIIAILQDLIEANSKQYVFPTIVQRERV